MPVEPYLPWSISDSYPEDQPLREQIKFLLQYAILAPSTFNAQPWSCRINGDSLEVYIDLKRLPTISDRTGRFGLVSIGCFIENFVIAANHYKWEVFVEHLSNDHKNNNLMARIKLLNRTYEKSSDNLFNQIIKRSTNRSPNSSKEIDVKILEGINKFSSNDIEIILLGKELKDQLINISYKGDMIIWNDKDFKKEHVGWIRNNLTKEHDGMPGFGVGIGTIPSFLGKPIVLSSKFASIQSKKNKIALNSAADYLVFCSLDSENHWVEVGRLLERSALYLSSYGIAISPMGQFIEVDEARKDLQKVIAEKTSLLPQIFLRIGYPTKSVHHSPRRSVGEVLL